MIDRVKDLWKNCQYKKVLLTVVTILLIILLFFGINKYLKYSEASRLEQIKQEKIARIEQLKQEREARKQKAIDSRNRYIANLDLKTDSSLTKFISARIPFFHKGYIPKNLESISSDYVFDAKGGSQVLRKEANYALQKMALDFNRSFDNKMVVVSAYRSYNYQQGIKNRGCPDNLCAKAGYSEHQSGLALDFWEATTSTQFLSKPHLKEYFDWLNKNAHKYGFTNTYQKGLEIDTYEIEPWHWRYVGEVFATYLKENKLTEAEFYNKKVSGVE